MFGFLCLCTLKKENGESKLNKLLYLVTVNLTKLSKLLKFIKLSM